MHAVRRNVIKSADLMYKLVQDPRRVSHRLGYVLLDGEDSHGHFEEPAPGPVGSPFVVVVDVPAEFPSQHIQAKVAEVYEAVVAAVADGPALRVTYDAVPDIGELQFGAQRHVAL